ncbi:MAG: hypothetical protein ISR76_06100 [Planctomycetes bacterium]|nr:hypothetical protein [Planctomycetota bacterium]
MIRTSSLLPLVLLSACGGRGEDSGQKVEIQVLVAWTAETEDGLRIAAEPLSDEPLASLTGWSEERLLRRELRLGDEDLLRLHVMGEGAAAEGCGEVRGVEGGRFVGLGDPPAALSAQARSLWLALGHTEALAGDGPGRRSFLLHAAEGAGAEDPVLVWTSGDRRLELQRRRWTGKERQQFLDPSPAPESGPSLPPGHLEDSDDG